MKDLVEDLIQRVLEGSATPEESGRLDTMTAADPALRRRREELEHVFLLLGSARLEPSPARLKESVLRAIREEVPGHAGAVKAPKLVSGGIPWGRLLLPVTALVLASVLVWAARAPWNEPAGRVSGTMAGSTAPVSLSLGSGTEAVRVDAASEAGGFQIEILNGDAPVEAEIAALNPAVRLASSANPAAGAPATLRQGLEPRARWLVHGAATSRTVPVRVVVRFADGRSVSATLRVLARGSAGP